MAPGLSEPGGCATHAQALCAEFARMQVPVIAVCRAGTLNSPRAQRIGSVRVIEVPGLRSRIVGAGLFVVVGLIVGLSCGRRAGFLAMQLGSQVLVAGLCARIWRRPLLAMSTSTGPTGEVAEVLDSSGRAIHRRFLQGAAALVAQTADAAKELERLAPASRIHVLPNPVPLSSRMGLNGRPAVCFTGRLSRPKDLPVLLAAWARVASAIPDASLTVVGDGGTAESVEPEVRETILRSPLLRKSVRLTGWVQDVGPFLAAADVFVLPSRSEGLSNSLLEACATGRVVVASEIPANTAVLGEAYPLLFEVGNVQQLTECLIAAMCDHDVRESALSAITGQLEALSHRSPAAELYGLLSHANRPGH